MVLKKIIKPFLVLFFSLLLIYLVIVAVYGGFGKKEPLFTSTVKNELPLLFAHRGISLYYPENSIEGVSEAKAHGFRAAEVDIMRSADDQNIIFHDETGDRLLGVNKDIDSLTLSELKQHPILYNNGTPSDELVPTVEELLATKGGKMIFYFDMKNSSFEDADEIVSLIRKYKCERTVILANWDVIFTFYVEANYPEIMTALEGFDAGKEWTYYLMPQKLKPDFLSGFYSHTDEDHVNWLKDNALMDSRIVYGVDSTNYVDALKYGFRNIIMDYDSSMDKDPGITTLLDKPVSSEPDNLPDHR